MEPIILNDEQIRYVLNMLRAEVNERPDLKQILNELEQIMLKTNRPNPTDQLGEQALTDFAGDLLSEFFSGKPKYLDSLRNLLHTFAQKKGLRDRRKTVQTPYERTVEKKRETNRQNLRAVLKWRHNFSKKTIEVFEEELRKLED